MEGKIKLYIDDKIEKRIVAFLLWSGILSYTIYFGYYTIIAHYQYQTSAYDFGIVVNYFWGTFFTDIFLHCGYFGDLGTYFTSHIELTPLLFIGPLFYLIPIPETILVGQALIIGLAALPIYLLSYHLIKSRWAALVIVFCYLINPCNHGANFYDYHQLSNIAFVLGFLIYFMVKRRTIPYFIFLILFILIKEDIGLYLVFISLYFIFFQKRYIIGFISILIGVAWFATCKFLIMPYFNTMNLTFYYSEMVPYKQEVTEIFKSIFINPLFTLTVMIKPEKLLYYFQMLVPFALLPFLRLRYILFFGYGLFITSLVTYNPVYQISFQYLWYLLGGLFIASIFALSDIKENKSHRLKKINFKAVLTVMLILSIVVSYQYGAIINRKQFKGGFRKIGLIMAKNTLLIHLSVLDLCQTRVQND
jgi:uncharacterized membrane protein